MKWTDAPSQHGPGSLTWLCPCATPRGGLITVGTLSAHRGEGAETTQWWKGSLCRPPLAKRLVWEEPPVLRLQELEPSRDGPGLFCGRQVQGPSWGPSRPTL